MSSKASVLGGAAALLSAVVACAEGPAPAIGDPPPAGTPELRAELFDTIVARTERREAWSPVKNQRLDFDPIAAMRSLRDEVVAADTEEELFYAISKLGHARRDRHLETALVPGGLQVSDSAGLAIAGGDPIEPWAAPVRIFPDYSEEGPAYFVGDLAVGDGAGLPRIGGRVTSVNGLPIAEWEERAAEYMRHSTVAGLRWKLAEAMSLATAIFPPSLRSERLSLGVAGADGQERTFELEYRAPGSIGWRGVSEPSYPGFTLEHRTPTYDLLVERERRIAVLVWTGFRETMVEDVDSLTRVGLERGLLDYTLIVDVTRSGGGSRGAYAVRRLQPKAFKTTFGNLRISDVTEPFVEERRDAFARRALTDGGTPETIDDGTWLMDWLAEDVVPAIERGDAYTNAVPFKSAHAPRDSDGILAPAEVHFRGPFAVLSGPFGGSHLDQFVHQVVDNALGPVVGMPPGGYSNTWEWEEVLSFPGTNRPLVRFMWNVGHTITPGGEIAEGNPAEIDEWIPLTADNVGRYYELLLDAALRNLEESGPR